MSSLKKDNKTTSTKKNSKFKNPEKESKVRNNTNDAKRIPKLARVDSKKHQSSKFK